MQFTFFEDQLLILVAFCICAILLERYAANKKSQQQQKASSEGKEPLLAPTRTSLDDAIIEGGDALPSPTLAMGKAADKASAGSLGQKYLVVYAIVMGADWLQGPYVYSLYREEYNFPERIVATLFVTGFLSAGLTAPLVGAWADQHGRRKICLLFCFTYTAACVCTFFPLLPILFAGRLLGGISTSILYSAFESWLVSAYSSAGLGQSELSSIMGRATLVNGFVATGAGIFSNQLVSYWGTFVSPFIASGLLLMLAWTVIRSTWVENYGGGGGTSVPSSDFFQIRRLGRAWEIVKQDPALLTLGLTQTCFEGSMYLFVFAWVPSLQEASDAGQELPLGYIFSSFMVSMMLGSLLYTAIVSYPPPSAQSQTPENSVQLHAKLSSLVCSMSAFSLAASVSLPDVRHRFWAFCLFEACVGMYYPVQGVLRGTLISNDHRATLSSLFRVPLNVFVVVVLMTGVSSARLLVFAGCGLVLAISAVMTAVVIVRRADEVPASHLSRP